MRAALLLVVLVAAGCGSQTTTVTRSETAVVTQTETATETVSTPAAGLPAPVAATHAELLAAAKTGDYEALRPLVPDDQFSYTFGLPAEGGPIAYWQQVEEDSGQRPIDVLARILELPYTLYHGTYIWPFAYDKQPEDLTPHERKLLGDLADDFGAGSGYLGWRAGIEPDGTWSFFIAGD